MTHHVHLGDSGQYFAAAPDQTLLDAGLQAGIALPYGCASGTCGACRCRIRSGSAVEARPNRVLSDAERAAGYALLCQAHAHSDIVLEWQTPAGTPAARPAIWPCRLQERRWLSSDVLEVRLKLPRGDAPFRFLPGQYVDFLLDDGGRRSFSLAAPPTDDTIELHIKITPHGRFGRYIAEQLPDRAMLRFEGPLGAFHLHEAERPTLLVAGGTGFAPIKAMVEDAIQRADQRPMHVFWGARQPEDLYLDALVREWTAHHAHIRYTPVCESVPEDWTGAHGRVHDAVSAHYPDLRGHALYASGPPAMVASIKASALQSGLHPDHLHYDSFDDAHVTWPGTP
ncbi:2Fe-2S iron-sulfur cluster-binding protein [Algiphilus sp.]|uniref:2Fe-2S iron-sulfur cluster-binding protein n=1 Tax=Algiphilus sp. TaxID=1872431 RepID=UPI002A634AE4|nr:2Fe-2S iron-sulfur cluster-binding protein [Pseudomonadota bacterium]